MNYYGEERLSLRANLHTHSTLSDGRLPPEQVIAAYAAEGYDVLAMTDHHQVNDVRQWDNHGMLLIQGAELHPYLTPERGRWHLVALNLPLDFTCLRPFETGENAQQVIDAVAAAGGITAIAHPHWCAFGSEDIKDLTNYFAMEVYNTACECYARAYSVQTWDELLSQGRKVSAIAVDDMHRECSLFGGWTVICAKERTLDSVMDALRKGEFYATQGPEFHTIAVDGDRFYAEFSEVVQCALVLKQAGRALIIPREDPPGTSAEYDLKQIRVPGDYARWVITDAQGRTAWSNPIYF
ncbi:MAG: CehA/McbA family metallohydrolase [Lentisphaeria bacterium]|nr:CehA/McbA family metallohydrolase [Lentisphaeria bacterium]